MAFTTSHPAAVLVFNYLPKRWFSLTALVIGSMAPDFEYFIRMTMQSRYSHTPLGLLWFDLPLSLLFILIYNAIVKDRLIDHLPAYLNKRSSAYKNYSKSYFKRPLIVIITSILIGAASHLLWDSFTHPGRYFVRHIAILTHIVIIEGHPVPMYNIVQHTSTIAGVIVIIYAIIQLPMGKLTQTKTISYYWINIAAATTLLLMIRLLTGLHIRQFGDMIVTVISGLLVGLIFASVITPVKNIT
jgi:hypothetical protein